tara:strand:- start:57 stop:566 length:510 start_codon:yes stop_codon:yes gene_type:complete
MSTLKVDTIQGKTTAGTVAMPSGMVVQVLSTTKLDDHYQSSSTSYTDVTGVTLTISPKFSTSKVLVTVSGAYGVDTTSRIALFNIVRDSTNIGLPSTVQTYTSSRTLYNNGPDQLHQLHFEFLDSPATTSATTYKLQMRIHSSGILYLGTRNGDDARQGTTLTLMEIKQ